VERGALAAVSALLLTACGDGQIGGPLGTGDGTPPPLPGGSGSLVIALADFPELATVGGTARVDGNTSTPIAVSRTGPSSFVAVSMICTHAGFRPIDIRPSGFRCPNHGAVFADDGTWLSGQRTSDLERYAVSYDAGAGTLTIS
jgi:Rieske Fe-S protein